MGILVVLWVMLIVSFDGLCVDGVDIVFFDVEVVDEKGECCLIF